MDDAYQQQPDGTWATASPLGWQEEHPRWVSLIYKVLGISHCGKKGWRR